MTGDRFGNDPDNARTDGVVEEPLGAATSAIPGENDTHERVRQLLAAAAGARPAMPTDVSERLDGVLASLVAERAASSERTSHEPTRHRPQHRIQPTPQHTFAQRGARRWPKMLVAAATVSVVGLGVGNVATRSGSGTSEDSAAGSAGLEPSSGAESGAGSGAGSGQMDADRPSTARLQHLPRLRTRSLTTDAQRVVDFSLIGPDVTSASPRTPGCSVPDLGQGEDIIDVRLDGKPAFLLLAAAESGQRQVQVFLCGTGSDSAPVASTSVDAD
ncbi:MAG: hypothetical protein M3393_06135 [Actinomycetota bacterium]|nr:hypothetical protein [Actinomycetota bacterium]